LTCRSRIASRIRRWASFVILSCCPVDPSLTVRHRETVKSYGKLHWGGPENRQVVGRPH
jgi:hypothetical protein